MQVKVSVSGRDDVTSMRIPRQCVGYITGSRGTSLRETEKKSGSFCFLNDSNEDRKNDFEELLIFRFVHPSHGSRV